MLVTRIGFGVFSDSTPRSIDVESPPGICRLRRCEPESLPGRRKTKGSVSARFNERLLVMVVVVVVVNAGGSSGPSVECLPGGGETSNDENGTLTARFSNGFDLGHKEEPPPV